MGSPSGLGVHHALSHGELATFFGEEAQYLSALGSFIEAYAQFEYALFAFVQKTTGIFGPMAVIAFGSLNVQ